MRDSISRALAWALHLITPGRGRRRNTAHPTATQPAPITGRHRNNPAPVPAPERITISLTGLRSAFERTPDHDPALPPIPPVRIPPYLIHSEQERERAQQRKRRTAVTLATVGVDYPYTYPGALTLATAVAL